MLGGIIVSFSLLSCEKGSDNFQSTTTSLNEYYITMDYALEIASSAIVYDATTEFAKAPQTGPKAIKSVNEIKDKHDLTATYVVNYLPEGYLLLSADKRTVPVLGFSNQGYFDVDLEDAHPALISWYENFMSAIDRVRYQDHDMGSHPSWESKEIRDLLSAKAEFNIKKEDQDIAANGDCYYPGMPGCCEDTWYTKGPIMNIKWNQGNGYNDQCPHLGCSSPSNGRAWTGCVATAMGQIMKYHQKPSWFNWSAMPNTIPSSETAYLLKTIGNGVEMNYGCSASSASFTDAKDAFKQFYQYYNAKEASYNHNTVKHQLNLNRPVMLSGGNHAWVTEGYRTHYDCENGIGYLYLYMNWGWGGSYDGSFAFNSWYVAGNNFNSNKSMIYDLY